jgi:hypothetical protein
MVASDAIAENAAKPVRAAGGFFAMTLDTFAQLPSPCSAGNSYTPGNPLTAPYRWDQGP